MHPHADERDCGQPGSAMKARMSATYPSVVMISHDLASVTQTCQRIAVLYHGEIVEVGDSEQIVEDPHPYTTRLLDAVPRLDVPGFDLPA